MTYREPAIPDHTPTLTSIGKDTLVYLPGRVVPAIMAFVTTAVLTRFVLSPEDFGRYDLTMRLVMFLTTTGVIWLTILLLRFYPRYASKEEGGAGADPFVFNSVVALLRWAGIGGSLVLLGLVWAAGPESLFGSYRGLLGVAALVFVGNSLMELGLATARAKGKPWAYSVAAASNAVFRLPLGILILWLSGTGVAGFLCGLGLASIVIALSLMGRDLVHPVPLSLTSGQKALLKECLLYGLPILGTLILNFFLGNTDRYLLKYFRGDAMVGAYAAACQLIEQPISMVFQTLMVAVFPAVTALYETRGREATEDLLRQLTRQFLLFCLPLCAMLAVLGHHVMFTLTGVEYRAAYLVAPWLVAAALVYGLSYYASFGLHLAKRTRTLLAITVVSIAVNLVINRLTIGTYGYVGCGMARLAANAVLAGLLALASRRHLRWSFPWASLIRISFASAVAGAAAFLLQRHMAPNLLALAVLGCVFCAVFMMISATLSEVSFRQLFSMLQPRGKTDEGPR